MSEIMIVAPAIQTHDYFRPEVVRTILNKLKNHRSHYADFLQGSHFVVRVRKDKDGYKIEYRKDNSGVRYCTRGYLKSKEAEKALIAYGRGSETWATKLEFSLKRDIANRIGYAIGRPLRPIGDFIRGFKIGYEKSKNN